MSEDAATDVAETASREPLGYKPPLFQRVDWQDLAACKDLTPKQADKLFYPFNSVPKATVAMCGSCPVKQACLDYAIALGEEYGVWGGRHVDEIAAGQRVAVAAVVIEVKVRKLRSANRRTSLSDNDVRDIRLLRAEGKSFAVIGDAYNIDKAIVRQIWLRQRFAHVADEAAA